MKKLLLAVVNIVIVNFLFAQEANYFVTPSLDTIYVGDTVSVGNPVLTGQYSTISRNSTEMIIKNKKGP